MAKNLHSQNFVKFDESGQPVRAILKCTFVEHVVGEARWKYPGHSPDTTKYHVVSQGDSLWSLAVKAYGDPGKWRAIARANGIASPREIHSGDLLVLPAL